MGNRTPTDRRYPPFFERFVPFALAIIIVVMIFMIVVIFAVALGLFPGRA